MSATFSLRRLLFCVGAIGVFAAGLTHENSLLMWGLAAVVVLSVPIACVLGLVEAISLPYALTYAAVATAYNSLPILLGPVILSPTFLIANLASRLHEGRPRNPANPTGMGFQVTIISHLLCTVLLASAAGWLVVLLATRFLPGAKRALSPAEGLGSR